MAGARTNMHNIYIPACSSMYVWEKHLKEVLSGYN